MKKKYIVLGAVVAVPALAALLLFSSTQSFFSPSALPAHPFMVQSIDTMKYSRDLARQGNNDPSFGEVIDAQMQLIEDSGATHVAIDTPYDEEFVPILSQWVASARAHHLSVWFRGNFSGWEGWFNYPKISRATHEKMLKTFLLSHQTLFRNGDIFSPCPECENGGPGDPRLTGDVSGYNKFLVDEYDIAQESFLSMYKSISVYPSMNADIARYVLDEDTAKALGGTVLIDHYVDSPQKFSDDLRKIADRLNAKVGIGEFGGPITDINGPMTQSEQARFVTALLKVLYDRADQTPVVNYWDLQGGSTALSADDGSPRQAYFAVQSYFNPPKVYGTITNPMGDRVSGASITVASTTYSTESKNDGTYAIFLPPSYRRVTIEKDGYKPLALNLPATLASSTERSIVLEPESPSLWYRAQVIFHSIKNMMYVSR